jgi:hypothetical protein
MAEAACLTRRGPRRQAQTRMPMARMPLDGGFCGGGLGEDFAVAQGPVVAAAGAGAGDADPGAEEDDEDEVGGEGPGVGGEAVAGYGGGHARMSLWTWPATSVRRKSRPV